MIFGGFAQDDGVFFLVRVMVIRAKREVHSLCSG